MVFFVLYQYKPTLFARLSLKPRETKGLLVKQFLLTTTLQQIHRVHFGNKWRDGVRAIFINISFYEYPSNFITAMPYAMRERIVKAKPQPLVVKYIMCRYIC